MTSQVHAEADYRKYWIAWFALLLITLAMIVIGSPLVLVTGMSVKAAIIILWFMHLRYEHLGLVLSVVLGIFATALFLFLLMVPDGRVM